MTQPTQSVTMNTGSGIVDQATERLRVVGDLQIRLQQLAQNLRGQDLDYATNLLNTAAQLQSSLMQIAQRSNEAQAQYDIDYKNYGLEVAKANFDQRQSQIADSLQILDQGIQYVDQKTKTGMANYEQRQGVANTKLQIMDMLAKRSGPQDWVQYNALLNQLDPPTAADSTTIDPFAVTEGLYQPISDALPDWANTAQLQGLIAALNQPITPDAPKPPAATNVGDTGLSSILNQLKSLAPSSSGGGAGGLDLNGIMNAAGVGGGGGGSGSQSQAPVQGGGAQTTNPLTFQPAYTGAGANYARLPGESDVAYATRMGQIIGNTTPNSGARITGGGQPPATQPYGSGITPQQAQYGYNQSVLNNQPAYVQQHFAGASALGDSPGAAYNNQLGEGSTWSIPRKAQGGTEYPQPLPEEGWDGQPSSRMGEGAMDGAPNPSGYGVLRAVLDRFFPYRRGVLGGPWSDMPEDPNRWRRGTLPQHGGEVPQMAEGGTVSPELDDRIRAAIVDILSSLQDEQPLNPETEDYRRHPNMPVGIADPNIPGYRFKVKKQGAFTFEQPQEEPPSYAEGGSVEPEAFPTPYPDWVSSPTSDQIYGEAGAQVGADASVEGSAGGRIPRSREELYERYGGRGGPPRRLQTAGSIAALPIPRRYAYGGTAEAIGPVEVGDNPDGSPSDNEELAYVENPAPDTRLHIQPINPDGLEAQSESPEEETAMHPPELKEAASEAIISKIMSLLDQLRAGEGEENPLPAPPSPASAMGKGGSKSPKKRMAAGGTAASDAQAKPKAIKQPGLTPRPMQIDQPAPAPARQPVQQPVMAGGDRSVNAPIMADPNPRSAPSPMPVISEGGRRDLNTPEPVGSYGQPVPMPVMGGSPPPQRPVAHMQQPPMMQQPGFTPMPVAPPQPQMMKQPGQRVPMPVPRQSLASALQMWRQRAATGGTFNSAPENQYGTGATSPTQTFNRWTPEQLAAQPFIQKLRGTRGSPAFQGFGAQLSNPSIGIENMPYNINLQTYRDLSPSERDQTESLYGQGLSVDLRDLLERAKKYTATGFTGGPASYG